MAALLHVGSGGAALPSHRAAVLPTAEFTVVRECAEQLVRLPREPSVVEWSGVASRALYKRACGVRTRSQRTALAPARQVAIDLPPQP